MQNNRISPEFPDDPNFQAYIVMSDAGKLPEEGWVAFVDGKLVAKGSTADEARERAHEVRGQEARVFFQPVEGMRIVNIP